MDRWKSRGGKSQRREEKKREDQEEKGDKKDAGARKGRKVAKQCVFSNDLCLRRVEKKAR